LVYFYNGKEKEIFLQRGKILSFFSYFKTQLMWMDEDDS